MTKQELALCVIERLKKEYPDTTCTLDYDEAWKLLVSVRLAAQCTDERVNVVVQGLYEKYPGIRELAAAEPQRVQRSGLSPASKARSCLKTPCHSERSEESFSRRMYRGKDPSLRSG